MLYSLQTSWLIGVEQELVGRKGNLGETSNSVEVYFLPFQFLFNPYPQCHPPSRGFLVNCIFSPSVNICDISVLHPLPEASNLCVDGWHGVVAGCDPEAGHPKEKPTVFQFCHQGAPWVALADVRTFFDSLWAELTLQNGYGSRLRYLILRILRNL